jgi:hypothetical protein
MDPAGCFWISPRPWSRLVPACPGREDLKIPLARSPIRLCSGLMGVLALSEAEKEVVAKSRHWCAVFSEGGRGYRCRDRLTQQPDMGGGLANVGVVRQPGHELFHPGKPEGGRRHRWGGRGLIGRAWGGRPCPIRPGRPGAVPGDLQCGSDTHIVSSSEKRKGKGIVWSGGREGPPA